MSTSDHAVSIHISGLLAQRQMTKVELAQRVGITEASLYTILRTGQPTGAKGIRFSTLTDLCRSLECQPGDLLTVDNGPDDNPPEWIPPAIRRGSRWCWEPLKPHAREDVEVVGTEWNGEEWWVEAKSLSTGKTHRNELSRFIEATVLVSPGPV